MTTKENIHSSAYIDKTAEIGNNVKIHPYVVIGPNVKIGDNCEIFPHAYIEHAVIEKNCQIASGAVIGTAPQDLGYKDESSNVLIGEGCKVREHVTVNRASGEGNTTVVGSACMLMTGSHVAHNCVLGKEVILANNVLLAGHVNIGDYAFIGGCSAIHQFVRIGKMVMFGGMSGARQDIAPYAKVDGRPAKVMGLNSIGLKRRGLSVEDRSLIKKAYNFIFYSDLNTQQALEKIKNEIPQNDCVNELVNFISASTRGVTKETCKD